MNRLMRPQILSIRLWLCGLVVLVWDQAGYAKVFLTVDEALRLTFPGARIESRTLYLSQTQLDMARKRAGLPLESALVSAYIARNDKGDVIGYAYFDTHRVRTLPETLMVAIDLNGHIQRIEVISFSEPEDYLPRSAWYDQFKGKPLNDELTLKRGIRPIAGATLTARATADAARRVLALHQTVREMLP